MRMKNKMVDNDFEKYLDENSYETADRIQMLLFSGLNDKQVERINEYLGSNHYENRGDSYDRNYCLGTIKDFSSVREEYQNAFSDSVKNLDSSDNKYILMGSSDFLSKILESVKDINRFSPDMDIKEAFKNLENMPDQDKNIMDIESEGKDNNPENRIDERKVISSKDAKNLGLAYSCMRFSNVSPSHMAVMLEFSERHGYGMSFNPQEKFVNLYAKNETELEKRTIDVSSFLLKFDEVYGNKREEIDKKERENEERKNTTPVADDSRMRDIAPVLGLDIMSYMLVAGQVENLEREQGYRMLNHDIADVRENLRKSNSNIEVNRGDGTLRDLINRESAKAKEEERDIESRQYEEIERDDR